jgi:Uma2 family endonuclease
MASEIPSMPLMTSEQFLEFCQSNPDLRVERSAIGEVIIIPPAYSDTGNRNFKIAQQLANWAEQDGTGEGFDSSSGFTLPNGAVRCEAVSPFGVIARCIVDQVVPLECPFTRATSVICADLS